MKQVRWFKEKLSESDMQTKWMRFVILWCLPLSMAVLGILAILYIVRLALGNPPLGQVVWINLAVIVYCVAFLILVVFTYRHSLRLVPKGYQLLKILFILDLVTRIITFIFAALFKLESPSSQVFSILGMILVIVNLVYFAKRKQLFGIGESAE